MNLATYVLTNLPVISCIAVTTLVLAVLTTSVMRAGQGCTADISGWASTRGIVAERREYERDGQPWISLIVSFSTGDGRKVWFTENLAAWQVEFGTTVPVLYDPDDPLRAKVVRGYLGRGRRADALP